MNIFIGNLSPDVTGPELQQLFTSYGKIISARVATDMYTGTSKGFAFVELESKKFGQQAIQKLNGFEFKGRKLVVNEARSRKQGRR